MWFTIGFAVSCAFCVYFAIDALNGPTAFAGFVACLFLFLTRWERRFRVPAAAFLGLAVGFSLFALYDKMNLSDAKELDDRTVRAEFIVRDYSYETSYGCAFDASLRMEDRMYDVRVYLNERMELKPGNRVLGEFKFKYTSKGGLDEVMYHRSQGIFLLAYQKSNVVIERFWKTPWRDYPAVWRQELKQIIDRTFPEDTASFAKALLLGYRTDIDYETNTAFKVSGISHIIAVSGLHVSILFGVIHFISGRRRIFTAVFGIPVVLIFAAVTGFTPSITRAAVMQIMMVLAMLCQREYDPPTSLSFSALVMLIVNPMVIASVSFQLSFACMSGIFTFGESIRNWIKDDKRLGFLRGKMIDGIISSISISVSSCVFTTPLMAIYFGTVSLVSILANLLTLWVITYIFYGIMAVCVLDVLGSTWVAWLAQLITWPIRYVLAASKWLSSFPLAAVYTKSVYIVIWLVLVYGMLVLYLAMKKKPALLFGSLAAVTLCLSLGLSWSEPLEGECRMTMLDVGQGQAILLQSEGKTFLVDCGGDYDEDAADITAETLLSQGISRLNGIILTHYDRDHAGAIPYLLTRIDTDALFLPYVLDENGVGQRLKKLVPDGTVIVMEDQLLTYGNTKISIFAPISYNSGNESSMSVLFQTENCDILITGDMAQVGERLLVKYHELPQVDVLVAGHHGAKTSTTELLLETVRPDYVFISVGAGNRYGHPSDSVILRLLKFGCIIYRTDEYGTIIFRR
jgi:competence protein ComEC